VSCNQPTRSALFNLVSVFRSNINSTILSICSDSFRGRLLKRLLKSTGTWLHIWLLMGTDQHHQIHQFTSR
jgi:hypothetical protein